MKVYKTQIESFIPQRPPFIMIDNLIEVTEERFESDFCVLPDNIFLDEMVLREFALIENIAQTSAAGIGYLNRGSDTRPIDGFIGGITKLKVHHLPNVNDKIFTVVTKLHQLDMMYLLKGENFVKGRKLLECQVKLVGVIPDQSTD